MRLLREKTALTARSLMVTAQALVAVENVHELRSIAQTLETCLTLIKMVIYSCEERLVERAKYDLDKAECEDLIDGYKIAA